MKSKITFGKIAGIIFCILMVAAAILLLVITADLRGCRKTMDTYVSGVAKASFSSRGGVLLPDICISDPELTDQEAQKQWMEERYGSLAGNHGDGVNIQCRITGMEDLRASDLPLLVSKGKLLTIDMTCKGKGIGRVGTVQAPFYKIGNKWYLGYDFLQKIPDFPEE